MEKSKCFRCKGKGGYEQVTGYFTDGEPDIGWDLCPVCDGTGVEPEPQPEPDEDWEDEYELTAEDIAEWKYGNDYHKFMK